VAASVGLPAFLGDTGDSFGSVAAWLPGCLDAPSVIRCPTDAVLRVDTHPVSRTARADHPGGLAVLRVLHGRIRSGEHEGVIPVTAAPGTEVLRLVAESR
jgi:hypothetical protein